MLSRMAVDVGLHSLKGNPKGKRAEPKWQIGRHVFLRTDRLLKKVSYWVYGGERGIRTLDPDLSR